MFIIIISSINFGTFFSIKFGDKQLNILYSEIFVLCAITLYIVLTKFNFRIPLNIYVVGKFILILWSIIVSYWAVSFSANLGLTFALVIGFLSYLLFYNFHINNNVFLKGTRIFGIILCSFILKNFMLELLSGTYIFSLPYYVMKEISSTPLGRSNNLSIYLEFLILIEFINQNKKWKRYLIIYFVAFILTLSRAGYISLFFGLILLFLCKGKRSVNTGNKKNTNIIFIIFTIISVIMTIYYLTINVSNFKVLSSAESRIAIWKQHISIIRESPLIGSGYQYKEIANAHNIILTILSSYGLIGFMLFATIVIYNLYISILIFLQNKKDLKSMLFIIPYVTVFIHSMVEPFFLSADSQIFLASFTAYMHNVQEQYRTKGG